MVGTYLPVFIYSPALKKWGYSALDKLLGQLGIYATWLSSIAYLQKQLCIFIFFYATFFFCDYTFSYCMKPSGMCLHIYSFPWSAFLKYQTRRFYCTLLTFERVNFAKFHFHLSFLVFFRKILDWAPIFS